MTIPGLNFLHLYNKGDEHQHFDFKYPKFTLTISSMDYSAFGLPTRSFIYLHMGKAGYNYFFCFLTFRRL